jgi:hypothetical protein
MSERIVVLPLSVPKRMLQPERFRSSKTRYDRMVWDGAWARVMELQADGWIVERVHVDFGRSVPLASDDARKARLRELLDVQDVDYGVSGRPRGETTVWLTRQDNPND